MSCLLPESLAEENEAELGQTETSEVDEDDRPVGELQQIVAQYEGASATDDTDEGQIVDEPRDPIGCLRQTHHRHRLSNASFFLSHHAIGHTEGWSEE